MALSKLLAASLMLSLLLLHVADADYKRPQASLMGSPAYSSLAPIDCAAACDGRCRLSKRPRLCKRSCGSCCARCHCVPTGTYGNLGDCPCYAGLTTRGNVHKCP